MRSRNFLVEPPLPVLTELQTGIFIEIEKDPFVSLFGKPAFDWSDCRVIAAGMADEDRRHRKSLAPIICYRPGSLI